MNMNDLIHLLDLGNELQQEQIAHAVQFLLNPLTPDSDKERFLEHLSIKGETPLEIAIFVAEFLKHAISPELHKIDIQGPTIDVCGTGGDQLDLFNVSTTAMFIVAAAGATVVKHGNRGITSKSGGADVLQALGIPLDITPAQFRHCIQKAGIGFMFAPTYHPAFKAVINARKNLAARGIRTLFNMIGPLLNPARPDCQLVGVFAQPLCSTFSQILRQLGRNSAWVVHGTTQDGLSVDELSLMGTTHIHQFRSDSPAFFTQLHPTDLSLEPAKLSQLQGGDAQTNAAILTAILSGKEHGPKRDIVTLNAAAAITCAGLSEDLKTGLLIANEMIDNGSALKRLHSLQACANAAG